ncbi:resolvase [Pseudomonas avellanae]|nr:resolvase [Pseudomonas avellanae]
MTTLNVARVYLRVSSEDQDLQRQEAIIGNARESGYYVAAVYREKASGARFFLWSKQKNLWTRSGLRAHALAVPGIVDLSQLTEASRGVAKVALQGVQDMLLRVALQIARDDFEDRRERQRQGIDLAKGADRYAGRKPDTKMHERVIALKSGGCSIAETARLAGVSVSQVKRVWAQNQTKDKV